MFSCKVMLIQQVIYSPMTLAGSCAVSVIILQVINSLRGGRTHKHIGICINNFKIPGACWPVAGAQLVKNGIGIKCQKV